MAQEPLDSDRAAAKPDIPKQLSWSRPNLTRQTIPSSSLTPPRAPAEPVVASIAGNGGNFQLRWAGAIGPASVLSTRDLSSFTTNWTAEPTAPYLSNGFWYLDLAPSTNNSGFYLLNQPGP